MALVQDRNTPRRDGVQFSDPVAAGAVIYAGAMYALNANGFAVPAGTAGAGAARAVAEIGVDNSSGADGALSVSGRAGVFRFDSAGGADLIGRTAIGTVCYVADDAVVAKTDNAGARKAAGTVVDVDSAGVWVRVGQ